MSHHWAMMEDSWTETEIKGLKGICNFWITDVVSCSNESKKGGKDQELIQSSATLDPGYHMGKWQKHN